MRKREVRKEGENEKWNENRKTGGEIERGGNNK